MASTPTNGSSARRKNGKDASCEPCRKSKIRCDHARPICGRCRQRSLHSQCFYHPAPLSRKKPASSAAQSQDTVISTHAEETSVPESIPSTATATQSANVTHLKGFSSVLNRTRAEYTARIAEVLHHLRDFQTIEDLMASYWPASQSAILPGGLIMRGMPALGQTVALHVSSNEEDQLMQLAKRVMDSTSIRVKINASLTPEDFMDLFTGENLRLEYLGLIFSIAARSYFIGMAKNMAWKEEFLQQIYQCSTTCLQMARELTPVNDMTVWLAQDHAIMTSAIEGDSSEVHWRCQGDLHLDIFSLGIYQESQITVDTPFFLAECRRRTYARAYRNDKFISALLDRPPRLLKRRSNVELPLDLTDEELLAEPGELALARGRLTSEGWAQTGCISAATWARIRVVTAEMTEEIFEYRWLPVHPESIIALRALADRNRQTWSSLPSHVQYTSAAWQSGSDPQNCFMLVSVLLGFLNTEFQLFQMIEKHDVDAAQRLILVSSEIVSLVLELGSYRRKAVYMHARFSDVLLYFGLAPALVLSQALTKSKSDPSSLPPGLRRSTLIRHLSAFICQLESISGPGEVNYDITSHAAGLITAALDEVLDVAEPGPSSAPSDALATPLDFDMATLSSSYPDIWEGFDLNEWQKQIDWNVGYDGF
ncbi:hypothetical protein M409DRAFT_57409 [Zasmidium cellare ATCC 36951]|uniref:Zn(2)-C6 fungal-type domain-containing protein n=1 Tax=Zasmidium cellare ATCC 36951 TaxID=1080233 RepID=A0A6A6C8L0_ZASCE|nr:uncharacterized protein M409DRAFT_57409 [Zasmidium cellare ATCC 36951]KAF2163517.1 hypothetical protein M409DRAFT_57409 [Zasmidium cellare ATCC 36951]